MKILKYILLFIFSAVSIEKSAGQDTASKLKDIKIYFQSISYRAQLSIASSVVIYDTYYNIIDSFIVPQEGLYLNLPKTDLIFRVKADEKIYRTSKTVFYADELNDSLKILIDTRTIDRCLISIPKIFFKENSYELDSSSIADLLRIKKDLLIMDDASHCLVIVIHSHVDVSEKSNSKELLSNRAVAVMNFLSLNTKMNFKRIYYANSLYYFDNPLSEEEHAGNRCVGFQIDNRGCYRTK